MTLLSEIHVSVDIGYQQHSVAIGLASGELLDEFDIAHRPEGFADFFSRIEKAQVKHGGDVMGKGDALIFRGNWVYPYP